MYDTAIIGSGPAGMSAALNLKLHNKEIIWFGSPALSEKVAKSEKIANYPGVFMVSGADLTAAFQAQIAEMDLTVTDKMVTNIMKMDDYYMLLADNEVYEAKTVIFATGAVTGKGLEGEKEHLGMGVSYCATCDGFLYKGKTIAAYVGSKRYEHEVEYLADLAEKVYLTTLYKDSEIDLPNVEKLEKPIKKVCGDFNVTGIELADGTAIPVDGVFFMRNAVAPTTLLDGLEMDGPHIKVNRNQETSYPGCYAAGDCTGRPYQIAKAVGEGNVAAHAVLEYLK